MQFDWVKEDTSIIKVIGVGGGGSNAVNHMFRQGIKARPTRIPGEKIPRQRCPRARVLVSYGNVCGDQAKCWIPRSDPRFCSVEPLFQRRKLKMSK